MYVLYVHTFIGYINIYRKGLTIQFFFVFLRTHFSSAPEENYHSAEDQKHTALKRFTKLWTKRLQNADRAEHKSVLHIYATIHTYIYTYIHTYIHI